MEKIKLDMHVHTRFSDGAMDLQTLRKISDSKGITPVITDHNTLKGALRYRPVMLAEEITTRSGEIIGYFMNEAIKSGLGLLETIDLLKEQDALVVIPHPYDRIRKSGLRDKAINEVISKVDGIEILNGRCMFDSFNIKARNLAVRKNLLWTAGSDAHYAKELAKTYIEMYPFNSKSEFIFNLKEAMREKSFFSQKSSLIRLVSTKISSLIG